MKATVIGGAGFIGSHLVAMLQERGWDCLVPARDDPRLFNDDLGYVFYCAGLTADYSQRPYDTVEAHACLLNRLLHHGRFISLVYLSSTRLYDGLPVTQADEDSDLRLNPSNPRHLYDLSKAMGESLCRVAGKGRAKVARLSCVYGDASDHDGFLPKLLRDVAGAKQIEVDSSPHLTRDYIQLADVLELLVLIVTQGKQDIYNVASGENISNAAIFAKTAALSGCRIIPLREDTPSPMPQISIDRIRKEFGWKPAGVLANIEKILKGQSPCCNS